MNVRVSRVDHIMHPTMIYTYAQFIHSTMKFAKLKNNVKSMTCTT